MIRDILNIKAHVHNIFSLYFKTAGELHIDSGREAVKFAIDRLSVPEGRERSGGGGGTTV